MKSGPIIFNTLAVTPRTDSRRMQDAGRRMQDTGRRTQDTGHCPPLPHTISSQVSLYNDIVFSLDMYNAATIKDILPQNKKKLIVFLLLCSPANFKNTTFMYYLED